MSPHLKSDMPDPPAYRLRTYLALAAIGVAYFVFFAALVSHYRTDPWVSVGTTFIHGGLLSAVMTWLWLPSKTESTVTSRQVTLSGILGVTAVGGICVSFVSQSLQTWRAAMYASPLEVIPPVLFYSLLYFVFSLPFATFLGVGVYSVGQIIINRVRRR